MIRRSVSRLKGHVAGLLASNDPVEQYKALTTKAASLATVVNKKIKGRENSGPVVPHPKGKLPVFGDFFTIDRNNLTLHEVDVSRSFERVYMREAFFIKLLIIAGSQAALEISDDSVWAKAMVGPLLKVRILLGAGLLTASGRDPLWKMGRNVLNPGFTAKSMRIYHNTMLTVVRDMIEYWKDNPVISATDSMNHLTLEIVSQAGFSFSIGNFSNTMRHQTFSSALANSLQWASDSTIPVPFIEALKLRLIKDKAKKDNDFVKKTVTDAVYDRIKNPTPSDEENKDLLDLMLTTPDPDTGEYLPIDNVIDQTITFLFAGHETTASTLSSALWYLATNPELQEKIYEQAESYQKVKGELEFSDVAKNRIVRSLIQEVLRLHPPVPGFFRVAKKDTTVCGLPVSRGQVAVIIVEAAQTDTEAWGENGHNFDPYRFLNAKHKGFNSPFGIGVRNCIGRQFALHEATIAIVEIVKAFHLELEEDTPMRLLERGTLRPKPYKIRVTPREKPATEHQAPAATNTPDQEGLSCPHAANVEASRTDAIVCEHAGTTPKDS